MPRKKEGKGHIADYWITRCLSDGEKTLGEIRDFLKTKDIVYTDNRALSDRLLSVKNNKKIGKHKLPQNPYPTYHLLEKEIEKNSYQASIFASHASRALLVSTIKDLSGSNEEKIVKKILLHSGIYTSYVIMSAWSKALSSKNEKDRKNILEDWVDNALPMSFLPTYFHQELSKLTESENEFEIDNIFSNLKIKKLEVEKMELILKRLFPKEIAICEDVMNKLDQIAKKTQRTKMITLRKKSRKNHSSKK